MSEIEETEKYYNLVEEGRANGLSFHASLDSIYWYRYVELVGKLNKQSPPPRRCIKRAKIAHAYYSDYRNK